MTMDEWQQTTLMGELLEARDIMFNAGEDIEDIDSFAME